ncbi:MAG: hypothetical protein HYZ57_16300 [Acidobacteria bacterium]|nr:hypothetical protein [Acidobacteriota bacterium]
MFDQVVLEIFQDSAEPEETRRHLYEVYGYAIQPRRFIKIFMLWQGGGDNGKSKLVEVLIELIGKKAVAPGPHPATRQERVSSGKSQEQAALP